MTNKTTTPEISVIMPVYNTSYVQLHKAITSILNQSFSDFEFIILNDSPQDKRLKEIIDSFADNRIKYFENEVNLGIAKSYNKLLDLAKGKYIALMNHDDLSAPQRLEKQYLYLEQNQEIGLVGTAYKKFGEINRFRTIKNPLSDTDIRVTLLFHSTIHHPTIMFRHEIIKKYNICYNEEFISLNDRQLYYDFSKYTKLANINDTLYFYRFHKNMTSKKKKDIIRKERTLFYQNWFIQNNIKLTPDEITIFNNYIINGRCRIKELFTLTEINRILEKLSAENKLKNIFPIKEFDDICAKYLTKRCLNAAWYGKINTAYILKDTKLPIIPNYLLLILNFINNMKAISQ